MKAKLTAMVLVVAVAITLMPVAAYAEDTPDTANGQTEILKTAQGDASEQSSETDPKEFVTKLADLILSLKINDLAAQMDEIRKPIQDYLEAKDPLATLDTATLQAKLPALKEKLNNEIAQIDEFSRWVQNASLSPEVTGTVQVIVAPFKAEAASLRDSVQTYLDAKDDAARAAAAEAIATKLTNIGDTISLLHNAVTAYLSGAISVGSSTSDPWVTSLQSKISQIKADGKAAAAYIQKLLGLEKAIDQQSAAVNGNKASQPARNAAYDAQLANAKKLANVTPVISSVKSKKKKVTVTWTAIKSPQISYYQVYYKVKGKKAVTKNVSGYDKAATYISYKTKKLKKGKKCTVRVRGVYKITAAAPAGSSASRLYYTKWSAKKTIKVK